MTCCSSCTYSYSLKYIWMLDYLFCYLLSKLFFSSIEEIFSIEYQLNNELNKSRVLKWKLLILLSKNCQVK